VDYNQLPLDNCHFGYHKIDPKTQHNCKIFQNLPFVTQKWDLKKKKKRRNYFGRLQLPKMREKKTSKKM